MEQEEEFRTGILAYEKQLQGLFGDPIENDESELMAIDQREGLRKLDDSQLAEPCSQHPHADASVVSQGGDVEVTNMIDIEVKTATVVKVLEKTTVKRKRGRPPRIHEKNGSTHPPIKRKTTIDDDDEEDVCFICFDGGNLVLCDRRGCPKAYHPACIKRDESFFRSKAKWNCGWHICSSCQKASHYMCYTCTYSLCRRCTKNADYVCLRENKGLCGTCLRTIMLIENITPTNAEMMRVDFDDKSSWEYLFKIYWICLKNKLSLTVDELIKAKNPWKRNEKPKAKKFWKAFGSVVGPQEVLNEHNSVVKTKSVVDFVASLPEGMVWATKELLEFVSYMKNGDTSMISQFDVQCLLLEYIKRNNLCDPHRKSQIICDSRLMNLFGRSCVGQVEIPGLLEYHFLIKKKSSAHDNVRVEVATAIDSQAETAGSNDGQMMMDNDRSSKTPKLVGERGPQIKLNKTEHSATHVQNINLLYLKKSMLEKLMEDADKFHDKVVGSFVGIKIPGGDQQQGTYRVVQVVGTTKVAESYKVGSRTTDFMLEILNLDKPEVVSIDGISNQEFSEFPEEEISRLNHLRDQATGKGDTKELREYVEKSDLLKLPMEIQRRLLKFPSVHINPNMYLSCESDAAGKSTEMKQGDHIKRRNAALGRKGIELNSPLGGGDLDGVEIKEQKTLYADSNGPTQLHERIRKCIMHPEREAFGLNNQNMSKDQFITTGIRTCDWNDQSTQSKAYPGVAATLIQSPFSPGGALSRNDFETEKLWYYQDPCGEIQGPFAMIQLRKWSINRTLPPELRVWRKDKKQDDSILLIDALGNQFPKELLQLSNSHLWHQEAGDKKLGHGFSQSIGATTAECKRCDNDLNSTRNGGAFSVKIDHEIGRDNSLAAHSVTWIENLNPGISNGKKAECCSQSWKLPDRDEKWSSKWSSHPSSADVNSHKTRKGQYNFRESEEKRADAQGRSSQSSGQNWKPQSMDSSSSGWDFRFSFLSRAKSSHKSEHDKQVLVSDIPNLTPKQNHLESEVNENKLSLSSNAPSQVPGPSWNTDSCLVIGGQLPDGAAKLGGYHALAKSSVEEWDSNLVGASSLNPTEWASDHVATSTSGTQKPINGFISHRAIDTFSWQSFVPNEFCSLADESVSDLLAEVEAMESFGGLPSPTSRMSYGGELTLGSDDDCFSPVESFSPAIDTGKSDALSSTSDVQMPSQLNAANVLLRLSLMPSQPIIADHTVSHRPSQLTSTDKHHQYSQISTHSIVPDEPLQASQISTSSEDTIGLWRTGALDSQKSYSGHSSSSADTKPSDVSVNQWKAGSDIQASPSSTVSQVEAGPDMSQGNANMVWRIGHDSIQQQARKSSAFWAGNNMGGCYGEPQYGTQHRYSGQREH